MAAIMHIHKILRLAEKPARPIHRRWPRYIGPYGWPDYFVKGHHRALRFTRKDIDPVFYDEIFSLQWMTFFWLALFLVIFQPNSAAFCRAYPVNFGIP